MTSVLIVALFFASQVEKPSIAGPKLSSIYDDIRNDIFEMTNMSVKYGYIDGVGIISIKETMPAPAELSAIRKNYENFVEKEYTSRVDYSFSERKGSVSGADVSMNLLNTNFELEPYNYIYAHSTQRKQDYFGYPTNNGSELLGLSLNFTVEQNINFVDASSVAGNTPIRITAYWPNRGYQNKTFYDNITYVNLSKTSYWILNVSIGTANQTINITVGNVSIDGINRTDSFKVVYDSTMDTKTKTELFFPQMPYFTMESAYTITIEDIVGFYKMGNRVVDYTKIRDNIWFDGDFIEDIMPSLDISYMQDSQNTTEEQDPLGWCYCWDCQYAKYYYDGDTPCEEQLCPEENGCEAGTYMEFWPM